MSIHFHQKYIISTQINRFFYLRKKTKLRITKSEIPIRTWRSPMSTALQGAFSIIPKISLLDISYITKNRHVFAFYRQSGGFLVFHFLFYRHPKFIIHMIPPLISANINHTQQGILHKRKMIVTQIIAAFFKSAVIRIGVRFRRGMHTLFIFF